MNDEYDPKALRDAIVKAERKALGADLIPDEEQAKAEHEAALAEARTRYPDGVRCFTTIEHRFAFAAGAAWQRGRRVSPVTREALKAVPSQEIADLWDFDLSQNWVRLRLAERIHDAKMAVYRVKDVERLLAVSPPAEVTDEMVERVAKALGEFVTHGPITNLSGPNGEYWIREARAALEAALGGDHE